jgi:hypothetical protein
MGRAVPGVVIATRQNKMVLVRFKPWVSDDQDKTLDVWFRRRPNVNDSHWSVTGNNKKRLFGPRYIWSAWARGDDTMEIFIGGCGSYYMLRTEKQMTKHGNPSFMEKMKDKIAELKATLN